MFGCSKWSPVILHIAVWVLMITIAVLFVWIKDLDHKVKRLSNSQPMFMIAEPGDEEGIYRN